MGELKDILYKLGQTREQLQSILNENTIWETIDAIDPHGYRAFDERQKESNKAWLVYFDALQKVNSDQRMMFPFIYIVFSLIYYCKLRQIEPARINERI